MERIDLMGQRSCGPCECSFAVLESWTFGSIALRMTAQRRVPAALQVNTGFADEGAFYSNNWLAGHGGKADA